MGPTTQLPAGRLLQPWQSTERLRLRRRSRDEQRHLRLEQVLRQAICRRAGYVRDQCLDGAARGSRCTILALCILIWTI